MRKIPATLALFALVLSSPAAPAEVDWSRVDAAFGKKPIVSGAVHKYGLPRSDLHVTLDGVDIKPALALGGWVAFEPMGRDAMMMGDLVLTEPEINPVMSSLLAAGVQITGVHNHLLRAQPATYYMHVSAQGDPAKLAQLVREALGASGTPFEASGGGQQAPELGFDAARLDEALGAHGKNNGGVYQFSFPRSDQIRAGGMTVAPAMGTATALNFEPTGGGKAAISGDFVAEAREVEPLLKALRSNGVEVTALHNHMLDDEPRLFFVHFWANDDAVKLAHALRAGLDAVHAPERS
ncbi:DUF1259 domain-containing protein [Methylocystis iwaonis]|uniref:DUF1259 domain-containing protein n=1 Tax=Methylocystis iwaonis TaxID=2885079 RepID=A0ABM8E5I7_9HYPH|nr:DUF1259 domain-containing protein [Methylocystis iwaonis]BDV33229.1 hypothetical protein SS37A_07580 [Methylocystis iwaonis]